MYILSNQSELVTDPIVIAQLNLNLSWEWQSN